MGADRGEHQNASAPQVFIKVYEKFGLTKRQIYEIWVAYNNRRNIGTPARTAIDQLQSHPEIYPIEILNYFTVIGLELFNKEYIKEVQENARNNNRKSKNR